MDFIIALMVIISFITLRMYNFLPSNTIDLPVKLDSRKIGLNEAANKEQGIFMYYINLVRRKYAS